MDFAARDSTKSPILAAVISAYRSHGEEKTGVEGLAKEESASDLGHVLLFCRLKGGSYVNMGEFACGVSGMSGPCVL